MIVGRTFATVGIDPTHRFRSHVLGSDHILDRGNIQTAHIAVFVGRPLPSPSTGSDEARPAASGMPKPDAPEATEEELRNRPAFRCVRTEWWADEQLDREIVANAVDVPRTRRRVS